MYFRCSVLSQYKSSNLSYIYSVTLIIPQKFYPFINDLHNYNCVLIVVYSLFCLLFIVIYNVIVFHYIIVYIKIADISDYASYDT